ncbi:MAG TPA: hypothetical protein VGT24_04945 [Candidatus Acidoferrales bacterium]|nr:hypothetical protein [Candidatus Acidoferrales bacterium]
MKRDAQKFSGAGSAEDPALTVNADFDGDELEVGGCASGQTVEVRRPDGANKVSLRKMAKQAITNVRSGLAHFLLEERSAVV